jgi:hypothetical protein
VERIERASLRHAGRVTSTVQITRSRKGSALLQVTLTGAGFQKNDIFASASPRASTTPLTPQKNSEGEHQGESESENREDHGRTPVR